MDLHRGGPAGAPAPSGPGLLTFFVRPAAGIRAGGLRGLFEPIGVLAVVLTVYLAVTPQTSAAYRHYVYMAQGFLQGRADVRGLPDHYHDVIRREGRLYTPFQPAPAVLLLPFVAVRGEATDQGRVGQTVAALAVAVFVTGLRRLGFPPAVRLFCGAALAFGSVLWPAAAIGTTWFFAQEVVVLMTAVIVWELGGRGRPLILGAAASAAFLSRLSLMPLIPALAALVWARQRRISAVITFLAVAAAGLLIHAAFNTVRFGGPLETGHDVLAMAAPNAEAYARWGFLDLRFVPGHLHAMLLRTPEVLGTPPFLKPSPWGMSLFLTSPVILRLLVPAGSRRPWRPWLALAGATALPMLLYYSTGWVQFGYRYSLDWWVFALVPLAYALGPRPHRTDYALLAVSMGMNALGAYWVRTLGW